MLKRKTECWKGLLSMIILMSVFALILFAMAFFLLSGKASVLIINEHENQH